MQVYVTYLYKDEKPKIFPKIKRRLFHGISLKNIDNTALCIALHCNTV
nr:MAG TPA: hypothetical protein [Caudoviricetes sp.]